MPDTAMLCEAGPLLDATIALHQSGDIAGAAAGYRQLLDREPDNADALHLLGLALVDQGHPRLALAWIEAAIGRQPARDAFHNTRGRALALCGRYAEAEAAYRTAWLASPGKPQTANNLACLLRDRGDPAAAIEWFTRANAAAPENVAIIVNLAQALAEAGAATASVMQFHHALLLAPDCADAYFGLGRAQLLLGQAGPAEQNLRHAIRLRPDYAPSHNNLGVALERLNRLSAAAQSFHQALRCDPRNADAWTNLGCLRHLDSDFEQARACHQRALACAPLHGRALWACCMSELPVIYETPQQIAVQRASYDRALAELMALAAQPGERAALAGAIGASQPFFLPYQGQCDRALQARYGALLTSLVSPDPEVRLALPLADGEKLRLGIVTGFACEHTVWRLMVKGWLTHIDRARFSVTLYHTGSTVDQETRSACALADRMVGGAGADVRGAIMADRPHALIYPELGMDPICARLAVERLARVQCVCWGQPQTSGLPSIDAFLSSAAMEPPGAPLHYTEKLVCLPNLGVHPMLEEGPVELCGRAAFGLRDGVVAFWCGQPLYKYLPHYDDVFARIAEAVPHCQFLFIAFAKSETTTARFAERLGRAFARRGLDAAAHCVFVPSMEQARFHASVRACDIVLDSIGWSGGKSTLDMLSDSPVIVTLEGELMRARHTAAILRRMGMTETITHSIDGYVAAAVRLAGDAELRESLRAKVAAVRGWLFGDLSPIVALEAFLLEAARLP
jgi:predicted O-linked N-acetylglucosamine transferase (SPINDLY family)